jgi:ABC-2 type transport system permease protein
MGLFLRIIRLGVQQQITYRTAILAGLATNFFFGLLRVSVLIALYAGREEVNGLSQQDAVTFVAISQALIAFLWIFGSWDLMVSVYDGSIGADLLKPVRLFVFWMARDLGRSLVNLVGRGLLLILVFALFYPITVPQRLEQWLLLPFALLLGWLVSFTWRFLVNLAAFWTPDARGIGRIAFTLVGVFSGFLMPLRLYPDWFVQLCKLTPFPALFNTTVEIYLGILTGNELWLALLNQLLWIVILICLVALVLRAGVRHLVIQGG